VKVQLDIFVTCRFMIVNVNFEKVGFLLEPYEGRVTTYPKTIITIVSIKRMNYCRNYEGE